MSKIEIVPITKENADILALPNEPFREEGRVIPKFDGKNWNYEIEKFSEDKVREECFPDENYKFEEMGDKLHGLAIYVDGEDAGYALIYEQWNKWLYLDNLLIRKKFKRKGLGSALIKEAIELAKKYNKLGISLVCQSYNLPAAKFYFKNGFMLGGIQELLYEGTKLEGQMDLYLYKRI